MDAPISCEIGYEIAVNSIIKGDQPSSGKRGWLLFFKLVVSRPRQNFDETTGVTGCHREYGGAAYGWVDRGTRSDAIHHVGDASLRMYGSIDEPALQDQRPSSV